MPGDRIDPAELERWGQALLTAAGLGPAAAETVAVSLVDANRRGTDSHGVARLPVYSERLRKGLMNGNPAPRVEREDGAVALVDADQGPAKSRRDRHRPVGRARAPPRHRRGRRAPLEPLRRAASTRSARRRRAWSGSRPRTPSRS